MAKRKAKKTVKATKPVPDPIEEPQLQKEQPKLMDHEIEVERQIAAIRAVRDVEIERLLTELRLLRSSFNAEQLQKPVLQVFEETLPNLEIVNDEENKKFEVRWKEKGSRQSISCVNRADVHASLLQRLSMAYPAAASIPPFPGFEYSSNAGRTSFLGTDNLHFNDFVLEEPSESQTLAMQECLRTPGVTSQRLSVGMTPKTLRVPKPGEMLLSVHGSPLGVYKENNMEAIHESEEG
ncbi:putative Cell division protein borealin [Lupinus albus]|uniref:Putative Cell division protein borealin n=1 Tax=Lupinus albus TaxID=3870 RepID=A0A6A4PU15_LUPAL|nr:putative Cell division protein borealin [Lupinus albus]